MNLQEEQEIINLSEICRVCLVKTGNMRNLFEHNQEIIEIITKLSSISNIEIEINETLPCFLCSNCEEKLQISYDFQQMCQKSHNFLLACLAASPVTFKTNSHKPLNYEESSVKLEIPLNCGESSEKIDISLNCGQTLEKLEIPPTIDNPDNFISYVDNDGLIKKMLVSYYPVSDIPDLCGNENNDSLKDNQTHIPENCIEVTENLNNYKNENIEINKNENIEINENENTEVNKKNVEVKEDIIEDCIKPETEKRTKNNQTMRLSQFSPEYVCEIMKKAKERFLKQVNCIYCGFMAKESRALSLHMTRLHKQIKKNWCLWCNTDIDNLENHNETVHKDDFKCPLCGKYNKNTGHYMEHLACHSVERSHVCKECNKCFISKRHLRIHNKVHIKKSPYGSEVCSEVGALSKSLNNYVLTRNKRKCKICEECFPSFEEYRVHKCFSKRESEENNSEKESQLKLSGKAPQNFCKICNKRVRSLQKHLKKVHCNNTDERKHELKVLCSYCGKRFRSTAKLTIHVRTHTGEMPYKCSYCDKRMTTKVHLIVHERIHTGEKPHVCKFCGKGFTQSSILNTHLKLHTGRPEQCGICHKRFCRPSELRHHMRTHTGEKPYTCEICGLEFSQQSHLVGHRKKHSTEKPHKCVYCDKSFKHIASLRSHNNIHLGVKPYKCSQCPYSSRQNHALKQHMLKHENELKLERLHKCEICGECFTSFDMYSLHYNSEHATVEDDISKDDLIEVTTVGVIENLQDFT